MVMFFSVTDPRSFHPAGQGNGSSSLTTNGYNSFNNGAGRARKPTSLSALPEEQHPTPLHDHTLHPTSPKHNYFRSASEQLPAHGLGYPAGSGARTVSFNLKDRDSVKSGSSASSGGVYSVNGGSATNIRDAHNSLNSGGGVGGGVSESNNTVPRDSRNFHSMDRLSNGDGPFRLRDLNAGNAGTAPGGRRTFQTFGPQHQNNANNSSSHPAWRRAKGLDGGWRTKTSAPTAGSFATTDDDDLTTTSGSYTLGSPDREEAPGLEDVPFHQIRDIMV
jgi:hypothetical protein